MIDQFSSLRDALEMFQRVGVLGNMATQEQRQNYYEKLGNAQMAFMSAACRPEMIEKLLAAYDELKNMFLQPEVKEKPFALTEQEWQQYLQQRKDWERQKQPASSLLVIAKDESLSVGVMSRKTLGEEKLSQLADLIDHALTTFLQTESETSNHSSKDVMINGLTETETSATASVCGLINDSKP